MEAPKSHIDKILDSLDSVQRAAAPDFFYTRLVARMEKETGPAETTRPWYLKPVYILSGFALVVAINGFALLQNSNGQENLTATDPDSAQVMASEYHINDNSLYDLTQYAK